jgi:hypothetical protein
VYDFSFDRVRPSSFLPRHPASDTMYALERYRALHAWLTAAARLASRSGTDGARLGATVAKLLAALCLAWEYVYGSPVARRALFVPALPRPRGQ